MFKSFLGVSCVWIVANIEDTPNLFDGGYREIVSYIHKNVFLGHVNFQLKTIERFF